MGTSTGPKQRGRQSTTNQKEAEQAYDTLGDDEINNFDDDDGDDDEDEENEDGFHDQRMPEQHPAVRTTVQLMGISHSSIVA